MALIGKELASDAKLDKVLCIRSGRQPIKPCTEGLANKGPSCGVVTAESGMDFSQELPPLFLGYTSLKDSGGASACGRRRATGRAVGWARPSRRGAFVFFLNKFRGKKIA